MSRTIITNTVNGKVELDLYSAAGFGPELRDIISSFFERRAIQGRRYQIEFL